MGISRDRLALLIGGKNALSRPVLIGLAVTGFILSFVYILRIPGQSLLVSVLSTAVMSAISIVVLLVVRAIANRDGWVRPHPAVIIVGLAVASLIRSAATWIDVGWHSAGQQLDSNPFGRATSSVIITVALGLIMAASAQLARERRQANDGLLAEQSRLQSLIETADAELIRSEVELRARAHSLLEPAVEEIRGLISGEISEEAAFELAERIDVAVNDVVRPASRELALSPLVESRQIISETPRSVSLLKDRLDITRAIRPGWLMVAWCGVLLPGVIVLGAQWRGVWRALLLAALAFLVIWALKVLWPRRLRNMPVALALVVLLIVYAALNVTFQFFLPTGEQAISGSEAWVANVQAGVLIRVGLAMLVSILAILNLRAEQIRVSLIETNAALEELVSRIKRETWLLHRSVSLAVHGTVQSALISTAMRLTAADRTPDTVADARRRLEDALSALSTRQGIEVSVPHAMTDLHGLWSPVVRFTSDISPEAVERLADDAGLSRCAIEICREATSNAIRHGGAGSVKIRIITNGDLLEIRVVDDGDGPSSTTVAGLGSQMLDETCLRWQLERRHDGGSELIAVLV